MIIYTDLLEGGEYDPRALVTLNVSPHHLQIARDLIEKHDLEGVVLNHDTWDWQFAIDDYPNLTDLAKCHLEEGDHEDPDPDDFRLQGAELFVDRHGALQFRAQHKYLDCWLTTPLYRSYPNG